MNTQKLK